ncbi:MAG: type II toxin-antitoxin system YafQ family toxin, partial [Oscillospiraceae bacterium]|nr:type II toxin-antitoxin system YafQ family toxin [Oscillospiraceae bacterium]
LQDGEPLPSHNRHHALTGNWRGFRECHIQPDWILIYKYSDTELVLSLTRTGSHSYLELD